jgi:hypothetical protein
MSVMLLPVGASAQDSLADVFPLATGNSWNYEYSYGYLDYAGEEGASSIGGFSVTVTHKVISADSIVWTCEERDSLVSWNYPYPPQGPPLIYDTTADSNQFALVESLLGNHRLYSIGTSLAFSFPEDSPDSSKIYRYSSVNSDGTDSIRSELNSAQSPIYATFTLQRSVGLSMMNSSEAIHDYTIYRTATFENAVVLGVRGHRAELPASFSLSQNYPNPFNPTTTIRYELPKESFVHLAVYNVLGQLVRMLVNQTEEPGEKAVSFDGASLPSGIYFYRISAGAFTDVRKMVVLK